MKEFTGRIENMKIAQFFLKIYFMINTKFKCILSVTRNGN